MGEASNQFDRGHPKREGLVRTAPLALVVTLALATAGCSGSTADPAALLQAESLRDGCVAQTLDLILTSVEELAPFAEVTARDELRALAEQLGYVLEEDVNATHDYKIEGRWRDRTAVEFEVTAWLSFLTRNIPITNPGYADELFIRLELRYGDDVSYSEFIVRPDPARGLVVDGAMALRLPDNCRVDAIFPEFVARQVADLSGDGSRVVIQTGTVDLAIEQFPGGSQSARAAVVGRNALVALDVAGFSMRGDLDLSPAD